MCYLAPVVLYEFSLEALATTAPLLTLSALIANPVWAAEYLWTLLLIPLHVTDHVLTHRM